jgi:hypothetical protein
MPHDLSLADIHSCLAARNALIVHFSSNPNISDFDRFFPEDLRGVIAGNAMCGLCCSAVLPGDSFHGINANSFGSIGVIIDLVEAASLRAVTVGDGGARMEGGKRVFNEMPFNLTNLENSLRRPSAMHNEWGIVGYIPRGIFVADKIEVTPAKDKLARPTLDQIRQIFPEQRIYSFSRNGIVERHPRRGEINTLHSEIYKR